MEEIGCNHSTSGSVASDGKRGLQLAIRLSQAICFPSAFVIIQPYSVGIGLFLWWPDGAWLLRMSFVTLPLTL